MSILAIWNLVKLYKNIFGIAVIVIFVAGFLGIRSCNYKRNVKILKQQVQKEQAEKVDEGQKEIEDNIDYLKSVEDKNVKSIKKYKEEKKIEAKGKEEYREQIVQKIKDEINKSKELKRLQKKALEKHIRKNKEVLK